jgi:hypothetical protein
LIQEDYDAAKPDCEMGEEPAALGKGLTGDDLPDAKGKYLGRMVLAERVRFLIQAPIPHSLQAFTIGYVTVHHCQQARYVHQFVHQFSVGDSITQIPTQTCP